MGNNINYFVSCLFFGAMMPCSLQFMSGSILVFCDDLQIQKAISESYADYMAGRAYVYNVARHLNLNVSNVVYLLAHAKYCIEFTQLQHIQCSNFDTSPMPFSTHNSPTATVWTPTV